MKMIQLVCVLLFVSTLWSQEGVGNNDFSLLSIVEKNEETIKKNHREIIERIKNDTWTCEEKLTAKGMSRKEYQAAFKKSEKKLELENKMLNHLWNSSKEESMVTFENLISKRFVKKCKWVARMAGFQIGYEITKMNLKDKEWKRVIPMVNNLETLKKISKKFSKSKEGVIAKKRLHLLRMIHKGQWKGAKLKSLVRDDFESGKRRVEKQMMFSYLELISNKNKESVIQFVKTVQSEITNKELKSAMNSLIQLLKGNGSQRKVVLDFMVKNQLVAPNLLASGLL